MLWSDYPGFVLGEVLLGRVRFFQLYRAKLGAWMRAERAAGDDIQMIGGCWHGALKAPAVHFDNGRRVVMLPSLLQSEVAGQGVCHRLQMPLKPAWAVTIHKSQGMSLDSAAVQTSGCACAGPSARTTTNSSARRRRSSCSR